MNCIYHPEKRAVATCEGCKNPICEDCLKRIEGRAFCKSCSSLREKELFPPKKEGLPSWVKGCGIGCGIVLVIFLICIALIIANFPKIKQGIERACRMAKVEIVRDYRDRVIKALDEEIDEEEVSTMFDEFREMVREGEVSFREFAEVVNECEMALKDRRVKKGEAELIMKRIELLKEGGALR